MKYFKIFFIVFIILFFYSFFFNQQAFGATSCLADNMLCSNNSECCSGRCEAYEGALFGNKRCKAATSSPNPTQSCPNPCSSSQSGTYRCDPSDNKKVQLCGSNTAYGSSCYSWEFFQNCSSSQVCSNGKCVSASTPPSSSSSCSYVYRPYCQGGKEPQAIRDSRNCIIKYECPETQSAYGQTRPTISITASKSSVKAGESFTIKLQASTTDSQGIDYINICEGTTDCTRKMCSGAKQCDLSKDFVKNTKGTYTFQGFAKGKNGFGASNDGQAVTITVTDTSTPPSSSSTDPLIRADKNKDGKIDDAEFNQMNEDFKKGLYSSDDWLKVYNKYQQDQKSSSTTTLSVSIKGPQTAKVNENVRFDAEVSGLSSGDRVVNYYWKFTNGGPQSNTIYSYYSGKITKPGTYTLNLEITTKNNQKAQASTTITITDSEDTQSAYGQTRPTISITASKSSVKAGESFTIKLQASTTDSQGIDYINICEGTTDCTRKMCSGAKQCDLSKDFVKNTKGTYTFQGFAKGKNGFSASNDGQAVTITVTDTSTPPSSSSTDPLIRADKNKDGKIDDKEMAEVLYDQTKGLYTETEVEKIRELWVKGGTITPSSSATGDKVQAEVQCAQDEIVMKSSWESVDCWVNITGPYQYFKWQLSGPAQMLGSGLGKEVSIRINSPGEVIVKVILSDVYEPINYKYSAQKTIKVLPPGSTPSNPETEKSADFVCTQVVNDTIEFKGSLPSSNYMDIKCTAKSRSANSYLWSTSSGISRIVGAAISDSIWLRLYKEDIGKTFSLTLTIYKDSFRREKLDSVTKRFSVTGHSEAPGNNPPEIIVALKEGSVFNAYVGGNGNVQINYKFCDREGDAVFTIVDWGDGNIDKYGATYSCVGKGTNHIYTSSGNYTITLLIYDEFGKGYVMKRDIYIAPSPGSGGGWTSETQIAQAQVDPESGSYSVIESFKTVSTAGSGYTPTPTPQPEPQSSQGIIAGDPGCPTISAQELLAYDKNKNQKIDSDEVMQIVDDLISGKITFELAKKLNQAIQKQCKVNITIETSTETSTETKPQSEPEINSETSAANMLTWTDPKTNKQYNFVMFDMDESFTKDFSQYRGMVQVGFVSGFSVQGWPRPEYWVLRTYRHRDAFGSGNILYSAPGDFCPPGKICGTNTKSDYFSGESYVQVSLFKMEAEDYDEAERHMKFAARYAEEVIKKFGKDPCELGSNISLSDSVWLKYLKEPGGLLFQEIYGKGASYFPIGDFWLTPIFNFYYMGKDKWDLGFTRMYCHLKKWPKAYTNLYNSFIQNGRKVPTFADNPRFFYGIDFYATNQPAMESFISQGGVPPASRTPVTALSPETLECKDFPDVSEVPSGWEIISESERDLCDL